MLSVKALLSKILQTDLVIERGTDTNGWDYKKYSSGWYEAARKYNASGLNITDLSAGTYYGAAKEVQTPSFSIATNYCFATNTASQSSGVYVYNIDTVSASKFTIRYRAHSSVTNAKCGAYIYIWGKWK